jgi:predicted site-specific integrase-resolvase
MNMMVPVPASPGCPAEDLMTRRQVASLFRVTSAAVASWARRGRLPEVRDETGRPRYRRADVEALFRGGTKRRTR